MPIPYDAFYPLLIISGGFFVAGIAIDRTHRFLHNGKVNLPHNIQTKRYNLDKWELVMINRDEKITGSKYIQQIGVDKQ